MKVFRIVMLALMVLAIADAALLILYTSIGSPLRPHHFIPPSGYTIVYNQTLNKYTWRFHDYVIRGTKFKGYMPLTDLMDTKESAIDSAWGQYEYEINCARNKNLCVQYPSSNDDPNLQPSKFVDVKN